MAWRRSAIIWTIANTIYWRIYAAHEGEEYFNIKAVILKA